MTEFEIEEAGISIACMSVGEAWKTVSRQYPKEYRESIMNVRASYQGVNAFGGKKGFDPK